VVKGYVDVCGVIELLNTINCVNVMNIHTLKNSHFSPAVRDNTSLVCVYVFWYVHPHKGNATPLSFPLLTWTVLRCHKQILCVQAYRGYILAEMIHKPGKWETEAALVCIDDVGQF